MALEQGWSPDSARGRARLEEELDSLSAAAA